MVTHSLWIQRKKIQILLLYSAVEPFSKLLLRAWSENLKKIVPRRAFSLVRSTTAQESCCRECVVSSENWRLDDRRQVARSRRGSSSKKWAVGLRRFFFCFFFSGAALETDETATMAAVAVALIAAIYQRQLLLRMPSATRYVVHWPAG